MGAFDYLICEAPVPLPALQGRRFQTKSIDPPYGHTHRITADGQLIVESARYTTREDAEAPLGFWLVPLDHRIGPYDYTGAVYFYDWRIANNTDSGLVTFRADFAHGKLSAITQVPFHEAELAE